MTEFHWPTIRARAIAAFRETPSAQLETDVLLHFEQSPKLVDSLVDQVAKDVREGKARSGWAVLRKRLNDAANAPQLTVSDESERRRRIRNAETYIRNAGCHSPNEADFLDDMFGPFGVLRDYADDVGLREQCLDLYRAEHPKAEAIDQAQEARLSK